MTKDITVTSRRKDYFSMANGSRAHLRTWACMTATCLNGKSLKLGSTDKNLRS